MIEKVTNWKIFSFAVGVAVIAGVYVWAWVKYGGAQIALRAMKAWMKVKMSWLRAKLFGGK